MYLLIIVTWLSGAPMVSSTEFSDKVACERTLSLVTAMANRRGAVISPVCVPKNSTK